MVASQGMGPTAQHRCSAWCEAGNRSPGLAARFSEVPEVHLAHQIYPDRMAQRLGRSAQTTRRRRLARVVTFCAQPSFQFAQTLCQCGYQHDQSPRPSAYRYIYVLNRSICRPVRHVLVKEYLLRNITSFRLLHHLPHLLRRAHFEADAVFLEIFGDAVTSRQLALLVTVAQLPGASQSRAAQEIGLDLNTCSDLVARSIAKGLLRRKRSASDGRTYCLYVTKKGQQALDAGVSRAGHYQASVAQRITPDEQAQLTSLLRKMLGFDPGCAQGMPE